MSTVTPILPSPAKHVGLVLTAGGARGAYQAGVLKRIAEIPALRDGRSPFPIIAGASAGAINGAVVAGYSSSFRAGTLHLAKLWAQLRGSHVFRTDLATLAGTAARMLLDFVLGSVFGAGRIEGFLDASPLRAFLSTHLPLSRIGDTIARGDLYAFAVTATSYHSGRSYTFIQGMPGHPLWHKRRRVTMRATLTVDHVLASSAIPLVFPPIPVAIPGATAYFGDGALRLVTPLSPAIRLGAERVFAIGVRCTNSADDLLRTEMLPTDGGTPPRVLRRPPLSQIAGVFMNAIFLDHLDADLDHLERMNELVAANTVGAAGAGSPQVKEPMRIVPPLVINPSEDPALLASSMAHRMPRAIRILLEGLGTPDAQSADLVSYLLFDAAFTRALLDVGYRDADQRIDEIEAFLAPALTRRYRSPTEGAGTAS
jgi:NTE family protein